MKVLQTLGSGGRTGMPGIFFYRRAPQGIEIFNKETTNPSQAQPSLTISNQAWKGILDALSNASSFTLSGPIAPDGLYGILKTCGRWNETEMSRIAAILMNEGSINLNGRNDNPINLRSDV